MPLPHPQCLAEFNIIWICMHPSRPVVCSIGQQDGCLVCFYRALSLHLVDACPLQLHITLNRLSIATLEVFSSSFYSCAPPRFSLLATFCMRPITSRPEVFEPPSLRRSLLTARPYFFHPRPPPPPPPSELALLKGGTHIPQSLDSSPSFTVSFCLSALVFHFF